MTSSASPPSGGIWRSFRSIATKSRRGYPPRGAPRAVRARPRASSPRSAKAANGAAAAKDPLAMPDSVLDVLPQDSRKAYDMREIIHPIVDPGTWFELKPEFARNILTGLARIDGWSVGILANQPEFMGGAIDIDASDKAARFLWLCDAYGIPVVFLHDCPGFMVGSTHGKARHHPSRRQDAVCPERDDGSEILGDRPALVRRRLLRHVRQGL